MAIKDAGLFAKNMGGQVWRGNGRAVRAAGEMTHVSFSGSELVDKGWRALCSMTCMLVGRYFKKNAVLNMKRYMRL